MPGGTKVKTPLIQSEFITKVDSIVDYVAYNPDWRQTLNTDQYRRVQVLDVLIGNGDRHRDNFFVVASGPNKGDIIPFDHNLAFATDRLIKKAEFLQKCFLKAPPHLVHPAQAPAHIMARAKDIGPTIMSESNIQQYYDLIEEIQQLFPDNVIDALVDNLTAVLAELGRKDELKEIFKWRRDALKTLVRDGAAKGGVQK